MQRVKEELGKMRRLERSSLKYFAIVAAVMAAGVYAFAIGGGVERSLFMRGDTHTVNGFSGYRMNGTQSSTARSAFVEKSSGGLTVDWGVRVWKRDVNGTMTEITSGSPVAVVTRTSSGSGIQSASWTPPLTNVNPNDALVFRVYIQVGSGWTEKAEFITNRLNASQIRNEPWTLYYYTQYETQTGGPPFNRYTRGTFYWGTSTYNSRVQGLNYTLAKTVVNQTSPISEIDTYPGQSFSHTAEVTCDASFCRDVTVYPQLCRGRSCTAFSNVNSSMGLSWDQNSYSFGTMTRGETLTHEFTVTAEKEGDYRIRFNVTSSNVLNNMSSSGVVDVHVTDVNLTALEHENRFEAGVIEYETTDTIDWFNTTLTTGDGTAFNLTVSPRFIDPSGDVALWGPSARKSCGNVSAGNSCEKQFSSYDIPLDAETGLYNFSVEYDWENFGPETNSTVQFRVVDVRGTFTASLDPESILKGGYSVYNFSMTNQWSSSLQGVNVSINCPSGLQCEGLDQNYWSSLAGGETIISTFNVSTSDTTSTGYHDVNVTVEYTNPNEAKNWVQVENRKLKVNARDTLATTIFKLPENRYNAEYSHNITASSASPGVMGPLNGTHPISEGFDAQDHWIYGTLKGSSGEFLRAYHQDAADGGWNQTNVGDGEGNEYCAVQTLPVNKTQCPNPPPGLAGFWALDESGGKAWDHIGSNHGILNSVTQSASGIVGNAYSFDGSSSYIRVPHSEELEMSDTNRVTVSAWVYHATNQSGWTAIVQKSDTSYNLQLDSNVPAFTVYDGTWHTATADSALKTDTWHHLTGTFDGSTVRIYVNGELKGTASASGIADASSFDVGIGANLDTGGRYFDGRIDQVRIYERQLSQGQIQTLSSLNQNLGTGIKEPRAFPDRVTRGEKLELKGYLENLGDNTAYEVSLNWTLAPGWTNSSGTLYQFTGSVVPGEVWWNNITADISLSAGRGTHYVNLTSNSSAGDRGSKSFETIDVYANTLLDLSLNTTDVAPGEKVTANIQLNLDTGGALANQRVTLKDLYSGETLGAATTNSNGEATITFQVPRDWEVTVHDIEAKYDGNSSIYTNPSSDTVGLSVHDLPVIGNVSYTPEVTGFGQKISINASVSDSDLVQDVYLNVTYPDGTSQQFTMTNITQSGDYGYNFTDTWQNGVYDFRIEATDRAGYSNHSRTYRFQVRVNATKNVVTDKDVYGPNQQVSLYRSKPVSRNASISDIISTAEAYAGELFSQAFDTVAGTSTFHGDTHVMDGSYFNMTEQNGAPPATPDSFEGIYTYHTDLSNFTRIDLRSYGHVSSGNWSVEARNYATDTWDQVFSATSTTDTWNNVTMCSGSACSEYVSNGDIEIRVTTTSDRGTAEATYSVDFQKLRVEAGSGPKTKDTSPAQPYTVGEDRYDRKRLYTKFDISRLPFQSSGQIESARLVFNVSGGFGTGELYHTRNFTASDSASTIHADGAPAEQDDANPVTTFSTSTGMKVLDVTDAVNDTFEAGKSYVGFQLREQGEDTFYRVSGPIYLAINYTAESELVNLGSTDLQGYLVMRVQRLESGSWQNVGFPVVDQSAGTYSVESGGTLDLARIWSNNGGFNTQLRTPDDYRVVSKLVDADGNVLTTDSGKKIRDSYQFDIAEAQLNLTNIEHENQIEYRINQYETGDTIQWINITINNSKAEAVDATINLEVLNEDNQSVSWGPDSVKSCGNIPPGGSCERQWNNAGSGYQIPLDATPGTFKFRWNTTLEADNAETENNHSVGFFIHHVPSGFDAEIQEPDNKIMRNSSTLYNFTIQNPWSAALSNVNVTVNCPQPVGCNVLGGTGDTASIGTLGGSSSEEVAFNLTTDPSTPPENYDINATVEYVNPGNERHVWRERENRILMVRIPGALLNLTAYPDQVVRRNSGYEFKSYANNTYSDNLTNTTITWSIPDGWNNASGSLKVVEEIHSPGELVWNNFTAEVFSGADLGTQRINITATNDQGREDNDFVRVDVYANTSIAVAFNETDPAVNETIKITATLSYENGTALGGEELTFRDETTGTLIGTATTDSAGRATQLYSPGTPYGNHTVNVSYAGSSTSYTLGAITTRDITVHDRANITNVSATPAIIGFGYNTTINATVDDLDGVSSVSLEVTYPNGTQTTYDMVNTRGNVWEYNFSNTWSFGRYQYDIVATDTVGITSRNGSSFIVFIAQKSSIQTERYNYYPAEYVNLTDKNTAWWNRSWEYRRELEVNETSGNSLVDYPVRLEVPNLGSKVQSGCGDLRVVENQELQDVYVQSCNPSGTTVLYFSTNISASASETDQFLYYGNPNASVYPRDIHAFRIVDSGTYNPGQTSIDNTHSYNGGNATFRQVEVTVYGSSLSATVQAYNYVTDTWDTLYSGTPADGTTILDSLYLTNPRYSKVNVQLSDTSNNPSNVYYAYNFTTPDYTNSYNYSEEDKLPSLIQNTGNTSFQGRVLLEVERNTTGSWKNVAIQHNDTSPRSLAPGSIINFANLWNDNPFYTGTKESGFYRAVYKFLSPSGDVLTDSNGAITGNYVFRLNPPKSQVNIEDIRVYNVTGSGAPRTDSSDLEDAGTNSTLRIYGGETYRFDIVVNNSQAADANWKIQSGDVIRHFGLNSSWTISPSTEIFYSNGTQTFTGGSFNGTIEWNTQGGIVKPGNNATFSYIIEVPNNDEFHNILFELDDLAFTKKDNSDLDVVKREQKPPAPLLFNLNTTQIIQGEKLKAYANWTEDIANAEAEYNSTFSTLNNFSVTPAGSWTNYTVSTDTNWVRGNHSFRFYAEDFSGNLNATRKEWFAVFAESQINASTVNETRVNPGDPVRFRCQVATGSGSAIQDYNVSFYNETALLGYNQTNSDGWASTTYSSTNIGYQNLTCEITADYEKFYKPSDSNSSETIRIAEDKPPKFFQYGANRTRVFKTTRNNTFGVQSFWRDNWELDFGALVEGTVYTFRNATLPYSPFQPVKLSGASDWANFTVDIPNNYSMGDRNWTVYVNDTSSNINRTGKMRVDIWAWAFIDPDKSGPSKNPVGQGEEFTFYCNYRQGNGTGVVNYPVRFWDNNTASGEWRYLGTNETQSGSLRGYAQWTTSYLDTGAYELKCNASENSALNIKAYQGFHNFSSVIEVQSGDVNPPVIINDNYRLNDTAIYKVGGVLESVAQWNETIDTAWVEYNTTNTSFTQDFISKPYTDNWTNYTLKTDGNWSVGEHWIKTYANDTKGNLNDTLQYLKFDVWGYSRVEWLSPTGTVEKSNSTKLKCGVYDNATGDGIANYSVAFYDDSGSFIGSNATDTTGEAVYFYNTSGLSTGEKTWSCRIQDAPSLYYNTSSQDTASETVNLVSDVTAYLTGDLLEPPNQTTLAQNQTFTANVSVTCNAGDCGQVNATMRYNASGTTAGTAIPEGSGTPFYTVGQNQKSCGTLAQGESCYIDWQVNATGDLNSHHALDALLEGENTKNNDTEDSRVRIDLVLIMNVTYEYLAFGTGTPGDVLSAPRNGEGEYTVKLDENSNAATGGLWMKMTPLKRKTGPDTANRRILPENTSWAMESSCSYMGSEPLHSTFSRIVGYLGSGGSVTQCFWQEIPYGKYNGTYNGTITIKVNATE